MPGSASSWACVAVLRFTGPETTGAGDGAAAGEAPVADDAGAEVGLAVPQVTSGRRASSVFGPMPETLPNSSSEAKAPCAARYCKIRLALTSPIPGNASSSAWEARLMSRSADALADALDGAVAGSLRWFADVAVFCVDTLGVEHAFNGEAAVVSPPLTDSAVTVVGARLDAGAATSATQR